MLLLIQHNNKKVILFCNTSNNNQTTDVSWRRNGKLFSDGRIINHFNNDTDNTSIVGDPLMIKLLHLKLDIVHQFTFLDNKNIHFVCISSLTSVVAEVIASQNHKHRV
jgi:hypothetical protein